MTGGEKGKGRKKGKGKGKSKAALPPPLEPQEGGKGRARKGDSEVRGIPDEVLRDVKKEAAKRERKREKARTRRKGSRAASISAFLLILTMLLGVLNALVVMWQGMQVESPDEILNEGTGNIYGRVIDTDGIGIDEASVSVLGTHHVGISTPEGWYLIETVPVDTYKVMVEKSNYTTVYTKVRVEENMYRPLNVVLENGNGTTQLKVDLPGGHEDLRTSYAYSVVIFVITSMMAGVAGVLVLRRKRFRTAAFLGAFGILSFGFIVGSFLCILGLIMLAVARPAFGPPARRPRRAPADEVEFEEMPPEPSEAAPGVIFPLAEAKGEEEKEEVEEPEVKALRARRAEDEISADEGAEARPPPEEEAVTDAEVREDLADKALEAEGTAEDSEADMKPRRKGKVIRPVGNDIVPEMERALKETLEAPDETETDIVASVLKKLDIDKPAEPLKPPPKKKMRKRGLKAHQERALCRVCVKEIILESEAIRCKCGCVYHDHCASDIETCMRCGRPLKR